jgi:hypothetical protein
MIETIRVRLINPVRDKLLSLGKQKVYVFGDSHTEVFEYLNVKRKVKIFFDITWVGGATALGLRNPNSKTNALKTFKSKILKIKSKDRPMIFQLGEVDTGFVMWYRAMKYEEKIEVQLEDTIKVYFEFLDWTKDLGFKDIIVVSSPLPTIKDNQEWGEVANLRKAVKASQVERTNLTFEYNNRLKEECVKRGFTFLDCDEHLTNKQTSLIDNKFLNKDVNNHHLDLNEYSNIIKEQLAKQCHIF